MKNEKEDVIINLLKELVNDNHFDNKYRRGIAEWLIKQLFPIPVRRS